METPVRVYELDNEPNPQNSVVVILDHPDWAGYKECTKEQLLADEVTGRTDMDDAIREGAGLESDGTLEATPSSNYLKNKDFADAGYDITLKNSTLLLDAAINRQAGNSDLSMIVSLSSAEILALFSTPIQKITQPTLDTMYDIRRVIARLNFVTTAYSGGGNIEMYYTGGDTIAKIDTDLLHAAANMIISVDCTSDAGKFYEMLSNTGISFKMDSANPTLGDGTIDFLIDYRMRNFASAAPFESKRCCMTPVVDTFTDADLTVGGNLVVRHNLNTTDIFIIVKDNTGASVAAVYTVGNEAGADTMNQVTIQIGSCTGTWDYMIVGKTI